MCLLDVLHKIYSRTDLYLIFNVARLGNRSVHLGVQGYSVPSATVRNTASLRKTEYFGSSLIFPISSALLGLLYPRHLVANTFTRTCHITFVRRLVLPSTRCPAKRIGRSNSERRETGKQHDSGAHGGLSTRWSRIEATSCPKQRSGSVWRISFANSAAAMAILSTLLNTSE